MNPSGAVGTAIVAPLIKAEGFGWCFTGLACVDVICSAMAALSLVKGTTWRKRAEAKQHAKREAEKEEGEVSAFQQEEDEMKE